jgi:hypothetical protein
MTSMFFGDGNSRHILISMTISKPQTEGGVGVRILKIEHQTAPERATHSLETRPRQRFFKNKET